MNQQKWSTIRLKPLFADPVKETKTSHAPGMPDWVDLVRTACPIHHGAVDFGVRHGGMERWLIHHFWGYGTRSTTSRGS
ncbi:hypothetical protein J4Q44_G00185930 [Coregonus suidteri]|uniref:Uncharacterized protein n=1 Tax=Coregonus suidteri TaxID=861788 RepID=A0AAN8LGY6_9TELE